MELILSLKFLDRYRNKLIVKIDSIIKEIDLLKYNESENVNKVKLYESLLEETYGRLHLIKDLIIRIYRQDKKIKIGNYYIPETIFGMVLDDLNKSRKTNAIRKINNNTRYNLDVSKEIIEILNNSDSLKLKNIHKKEDISGLNFIFYR